MNFVRIINFSRTIIGQWGAERIINNKSEQTPRWPTNKIKNPNNKTKTRRKAKDGGGGKIPCRD